MNRALTSTTALQFGILVAVLVASVTADVTASAAAPARALRDPFLRPFQAGATGPAPAPDAAPQAPPRLRALILNGARSLANIDGNIVATGERVAGHTVLRIDARGVLLAHAGGERLLTMQDKDVQ